MAGNWAPKILLPLLPQHWDCRYVPASTAFLHGLWGSNLGPHIGEASTLCLNTPLSAPPLTWTGTWGPVSELYLWGFAHVRWWLCVSCGETRRGWTPMWSHHLGSWLCIPACAHYIPTGLEQRGALDEKPGQLLVLTGSGSEIPYWSHPS